MDKAKCNECGEKIKEFCGNCMGNKIEELENELYYIKNEIDDLKKNS